MIKLSAKIISSIVGLAVVGTVTATAAVANNHNSTQPINSSKTETEVLPSSQMPSHPVSSAIESKSPSAAISSKGTVSTVADGIGEIQQETDKAVSRIQKAADDGVSAVKQAQSQTNSKANSGVKYAVINPENGSLVYSNDPNYEKYKAELGGDAGTTTTKNSTACQVAIKKIQERNLAKERAESGTSAIPNK